MFAHSKQKYDHEATESKLHLNDRCFYSRFRITPDLQFQKHLWILYFSKSEKAVAFFAFSPSHRKKPLRKQKVTVCDWWISIHFCVSGFVALFLKSTVSFTLALSFFVFFILKHAKFRFPRWNCSYWASQYGRVKTNRYVPANIQLLTNTVDATVTVWLKSRKNLNLEHAQCELLRMSAEVPSASWLI